MGYINTTTGTRVWIGNKEYTEFLINGSVSDESTLSSSIVKTSGSITLGGVHNSIITKEFPMPIGSEIIVQCTLPNNVSTRHPRGTLYLVNTTINYEQQTVTLEIGCSLYLASVYEGSFKTRVRSLFNFIPERYDVFDVKNFDLSELSNVLQALGYVMYQDKYGKVQCVKAFGGTSLGSVTTSSKFTSYDDSTAISIESLSETSSLVDPSELTITMSWDIPTREEQDPEDEPEPADDDGDGIPNYIDSDDDNDGIPDTQEEDPCDPASNDGDSGGNAADKTIQEKQYLRTKYFALKSLQESLVVFDGTKETIEENKTYQCGKFINPQYTTDVVEANKPGSCKKLLTRDEWVKQVDRDYAYSVEGKLETEENKNFGDQIEKFSYTEYNGPGKQLSYEETWEVMSLWRAGEPAIGQWFENMSKVYDLAIEEANSLSQEMNEYARLRDENDINKKDPVEKPCLSADEVVLMNQTKGFYDCLFAARAEERGWVIEYAESIWFLALKKLNEIFGWTATTNKRTKSISFGSGGQVTRIVEKDYIHSGSAKATVDLIKRAGEILDEPEQSGAVVDNRRKTRYKAYDFGPPLDKILGNYTDTDPSFSSAGEFYQAWPLQWLKSESIEEYFYGIDGAGTVTQKITKIDYENPENNTIDIKVSTDNSTASTAQPRNEADTPVGCQDLDGDGIPNDEDLDKDGDGDPNVTDPDDENPNINSQNELKSCSIPTESREVVYRMTLGNTTQTIGGSWLGGFTPSPEEISMPISFKPLIPEVLQDKTEDEMTQLSCDTLTSDFIRTATANMSVYERYINKYLAVEVAKRKMDNRGVRVVEKMRAELFEYYPFMPITIVINANKKKLIARTSAATWAFDSTNALCSLDCYVLN
ncbi:MAG: hypothetical protein ACO236_00965 [Candidatus Nanopelagicaceae bacterium]